MGWISSDQLPGHLDLILGFIRKPQHEKGRPFLSQTIEDLGSAFDIRQGEVFVGYLEKPLASGFDPDLEIEHAGCLHALDKLFVDKFDPGQALPIDLEPFFLKSVAEAKYALAVEGKGVVLEIDVAGLEAVLNVLDLGYDVGDGAIAGAALPETGTESAVVGTAAAGHDHTHVIRPVTVHPVKRFAVRKRKSIQIGDKRPGEVVITLPFGPRKARP